MKKVVLLFVLFSIFSQKMYAQAEVERSLGEFSGISVEQSIQAELIKGTSNRVVLTIEGVKEDKVLSDIVDGKLILSFKNVKKMDGVSVKAKVYSAGKIGIVEVSSSASLNVKDVPAQNSLAVTVTTSSTVQLNANTSTLTVKVSGSSKLEMTVKAETATVSIGSSGKAKLDIETSDLDATVAGKGRLDINGKTETLKLNSNSSGKFMGYGLPCKSLTAQAHGNGYAEVTVSDSIFANVVSGGKIYYKGSPADLKVNATGSGVVAKFK